MWFVVSLTWTFPPILKDFDSQGMAASRAAHFPHILRASRQMTAAARHNAACRRVFCALMVELQAKEYYLLERQSESALCMADTVNSYTHDNLTC